MWIDERCHNDRKGFILFEDDEDSVGCFIKELFLCFDKVDKKNFFFVEKSRILELNFLIGNKLIRQI